MRRCNWALGLTEVHLMFSAGFAVLMLLLARCSATGDLNRKLEEAVRAQRKNPVKEHDAALAATSSATNTTRTSIYLTDSSVS